MTTCLDPIEKFVASVYTRELFADVKKEIEGVGAVNFVAKVRRSTTMVYTLEEYREPGRHLIVLYDRVLSNLVCPCYFWNKKGYPCRHMFFVMKYEHLTEIPDRLVLKKWRQDAKSLEHYVEVTDDGSERSILLRHGALHTASQWMLFVGSRKSSFFIKAMNGIRAICEDLEANCKDFSGAKKQTNVSHINDPVVVKTKGAPRVKRQNGKKRRCGKYRKFGHNKRQCRGRGEDMASNREEQLQEEGVAGFGSEGSSPTEFVRCSVSTAYKNERGWEYSRGLNADGHSEFVDQAAKENNGDQLMQMMSKISAMSARLVDMLGHRS
ncbi:uncharacterized protein LOC107608665 [Arachis ipaensis]|uniref:uncharacterized protein LOC107608665 n=1 Tax=Arachis ipaensis TaxID=130454 RepID=UPI000A2B19AA|nr:uncharacterized protein LOC107608665 [Arachis ipaensis]